MKNPFQLTWQFSEDQGFRASFFDSHFIKFRQLAQGVAALIIAGISCLRGPRVCALGNTCVNSVRGTDAAFLWALLFSALDAENEHLVQQALDRLMEGRTVLIIAHRLSTIKNANVVAVLDRGRIIECGKHEELLLKPDGMYRKLMNKQSFVSA